MQFMTFDDCLWYSE